jgi:phospholipid-binding lipoprotein MlaA
VNLGHVLPVGLFGALLLAGCVSTPTASAQPATPSTPAAAPASDDDVTVHDPWEPMNRAIFGFNEGLDRWFLEPVATGWDFVMPDPVEHSIQHFFRNLHSPVVFVNNVLQGKGEGAITEVGRFMINTTVGVAGFFDPATFLNMPNSDEDFGQTLGVWGVPGGPYLVLPLLGPSNPRDTGGLIGDYAMTGYTWFIPWYASAGLTSVRIVNQRSRLLETIREERKAAFDFYVAVRNAYVQRRDDQIGDRKPKSEESDDDLYNVDLLDNDPQ